VTRTRAAAAMAFGSIVSVQLGAALATTLFSAVGPWGAVLMRSAFGTLALARGRLRRLRGRELREVVVFGLALAGMSLCFYGALDRLPLGVAVTLEFVGPLGVAVFGSRRRRDLLWALLAAAGILLLADGGGSGIDALGAALALAAGGFWALYILQSARVGAFYPGVGGLMSALAIASLLLLPFGIAQGGGELLSPAHLAVGAAVGVLSAAVPCALEMEALRRLPNATFGVLMSLEPAVATLIGFVALSQSLAAVEVVAIGLVVAACAGALRSAATPAPPRRLSLVSGLRYAGGGKAQGRPGLAACSFATRPAAASANAVALTVGSICARSSRLSQRPIASIARSPRSLKRPIPVHLSEWPATVALIRYSTKTTSPLAAQFATSRPMSGIRLLIPRT
jgi:inner membrane transporter RhtA